MSDVNVRSRTRGRRGLAITALLALSAIAPMAAQAKPHHHKAKPKSTNVKVMTRNLYLGADLGPAINATGFNDFIDKNGQILRDVDTNNFPVRAKGLAKEILGKQPDLVGLEEASMWRTGPVNLGAAAAGGCGTGLCTATTVKYDYIKLLLAQLNKGKKRYRVVRINSEFDFEAPADYNDVPGDGPGPAGIDDNGEIDGRLTMRDAILARVGTPIKISNVKTGHYTTLYEPTISGINVPVTRGWLSADATVRGSSKFRFIATHLESFGDPAIREAQAKELYQGNGPANTKLPVVLVGDLNSDDNTVVGADRLAYDALKTHGFVERSTANPLGCCLNTDILTDDLGAASDFDHQVDHIMTREPKRVKLVNSAVTGRSPVNGYWDSDHAGLFSTLKILR